MKASDFMENFPVCTPLYRTDPYAQSCEAEVCGHLDGAVVVTASVFYPSGGGQPGDSGVLQWAEGTARVIDTRKLEGGALALQLEEGATLPPLGAALKLELDWARRYAHMRSHTALHLLSVVVPLPVTGGQIGEGRGRLDFDMPEAPEDRDALEAALNALIARDLPVTEDWILDAELEANPALVKTMSVRPPMGQGRVRMIGIGTGSDRVDWQPCGGTHVARTGEIGRVTLGKIEKKGRNNRRVQILLED
jgi:misacylated tRNA(Ala) deacylase